MYKITKLALLLSLFSFSVTKPLIPFKLLLGTTAAVATSAAAYHVWSHYQVTKTLGRLINTRCDRLDESVDSMSKNIEAINDRLSTQEELLRTVLGTVNKNHGMLRTLLTLKSPKLSPKQIAKYLQKGAPSSRGTGVSVACHE